MQVATLYFGGDVSELDWQAYARNTLTPAFPDGFTTTPAQGQWRNPKSGRIVHEATRVVTVAEPDVAAKVPPVIERYRKRFQQISVGLAIAPMCAAF